MNVFRAEEAVVIKTENIQLVEEFSYSLYAV